ncbi:hypothetical protein L1987_83266 [Smallanthus sonchifolius]|uniref:Uncharacterized protein n=1 Tax=Smallanthus sonchifolius TaxID=185202 RepID=A0ACB8YCE3_9ASTR|nr:hypothetical protein L1987_83266 [Smallanthus sonchifolius]
MKADLLMSEFVKKEINFTSQKLMPDDFVNLYLFDTNLDLPVTIHSTHFGDWNVMIEKTKHRYFKSQAWENVIKDISIDFGHILLFEP